MTLQATPLQNGQARVNTQTVLRKPRSRSNTVTLENQLDIANEIDKVRKMTECDDPLEEVSNRMQKIFAQRETEWSDKLKSIKENLNDELAMTKLKLKAALKTISNAEEFFDVYTPNSTAALQQTTVGPHSNGCIQVPNTPMPQGNLNVTLQNTTINNVCTFNQIDNQRMVELIKERDSLKEELRDLENSYSDLFKRYEKMRENGVLLKNGVESLTQSLEDERVKYERLASIYSELRESAANQLNSANYELQQVSKEHEDNTLNLRCRLKRYESEINSLNLTIKGKDAQIEELNKLCDDLMKQNGPIDELDSQDDDY